jgi:hypothetical protein
MLVRSVARLQTPIFLVGMRWLRVRRCFEPGAVHRCQRSAEAHDGLDMSAPFVNCGARFGRAGNVRREVVKGVVSTHAVVLASIVSRSHRTCGSCADRSLAGIETGHRVAAPTFVGMATATQRSARTVTSTPRATSLRSSRSSKHLPSWSATLWLPALRSSSPHSGPTSFSDSCWLVHSSGIPRGGLQRLLLVWLWPRLGRSP